MRVLVVSDLHLGSPSRFPDADAKLIEILHKKEWDRVVLLGDVFDLWLDSLEKILAQHAALMDAIDKQKDVIYLPGNHDREFLGAQRLNNMRVVSHTYKMTDGGRSIGFIHGDRYDPAESLGPVSRLAVWIGALVDRLTQRLLGPAVSVQRVVRWSVAKVSSVKDIADTAARKAVDDLRTDVVVMGHFHVPRGPELINNRLFVNTGDFGPDHMTWVEIEDGILKPSW